MALPHWRLTRLRRKLFWVSVALYAAGLPVLLLFAFGIELNPATRVSLEETASFSVSTAPPGARVVLPGRKALPSPAVFDGLQPDPYAFSVSGDSDRTWTGTFQARAGLVSTITGLTMVSAKAPLEVLTFSSSTSPVLLDAGTSVAWVLPGEDGVDVAHVDHGKVATVRVDLPALTGEADQALDLLDLTGQLLYRWKDKGGSHLAVLRTARGSPPLQQASPTLRVADAAVRVLSVSVEQGSIVALDARGVGRYDRDGARESVVAFKAPLLASGYLHGRWYALDRAGDLYQYGAPLLPSAAGRVDVSAAARPASTETLTIVAAEGERVECYSSARRSLLVFTPTVSTEYPNIDGADATKGGDAAWLWSGNALYESLPAVLPKEHARLGSPVLGVREDFLPRILAVTARDGVYLLPSLDPLAEQVQFLPLQAVVPGPQEVPIACGEGTVLLAKETTAAAKDYRLLWCPP